MNTTALVALLALYGIVYSTIRIMGRIRNGHWHKANYIKK